MLDVGQFILTLQSPGLGREPGGVDIALQGTGTDIERGDEPPEFTQIAGALKALLEILLSELLLQPLLLLQAAVDQPLAGEDLGPVDRDFPGRSAAADQRHCLHEEKKTENRTKDLLVSHRHAPASNVCARNSLQKQTRNIFIRSPRGNLRGFHESGDLLGGATSDELMSGFHVRPSVRIIHAGSVSLDRRLPSRRTPAEAPDGLTRSPIRAIRGRAVPPHLVAAVPPVLGRNTSAIHTAVRWSRRWSLFSNFSAKFFPNRFAHVDLAGVFTHDQHGRERVGDAHEL